ncbi:galectin-5-like [Haliotis cracherodii]|uniref:galectin-5-like n=1 Tax=Haliotis cracherodii TaxID=6455 RepID=UPI0039E93976
MYLRLFTTVLFLIGVGSGCCTCFNASSVVAVDAHIERYVFRKVRSQSLYSCASACLMSSVCMSFNFETKTRICELNSNSSDQVAITTQAGFLFGDINHWPKVMNSLMAVPCGNSTSFKVTVNITPTTVNRLHTDFYAGGNVLYHISFRLNENRLEFNSQTSNEWGTEIRLSPVPLAVGKESLVEIRLDQGMYMLAVDGSSIHNFTDRYPDAIPESIKFGGDAIVTAVYITM